MVKNKQMTLGEALEIVYQLANQNAIYNSRESWMVEPDDLGTVVDKNLAKEAVKQREALNQVHDMIVNHFAEEEENLHHSVYATLVNFAEHTEDYAKSVMNSLRKLRKLSDKQLEKKNGR